MKVFRKRFFSIKFIVAVTCHRELYSIEHRATFRCACLISTHLYISELSLNTLAGCCDSKRLMLESHWWLLLIRYNLWTFNISTVNILWDDSWYAFVDSYCRDSCDKSCLCSFNEKSYGNFRRRFGDEDIKFLLWMAQRLIIWWMETSWML